MNKKNEHPSYTKSVFQIQNWLYIISQTDPDVLRVNPDGIYGDETTAAVLSFQKKHRLMQTGTVDFETWKKLYSEFKISNEVLSDPTKISPFSAVLKDRSVVLGDCSDIVFFIKLMLLAMSIEHDYINNLYLNNTFDENTSKIISDFQRINGLDATGEINLQTWNALAAAYNRCVQINQ